MQYPYYRVTNRFRESITFGKVSTVIPINWPIQNITHTDFSSGNAYGNVYISEEGKIRIKED